MYKFILMLAIGIAVASASDVIIGPADGPPSSYPFCGS